MELGKRGTYIVHLHLVNLVHETVFCSSQEVWLTNLVRAGGFLVLFRAGSGSRIEAMMPAVRLPV